MKILLECRRLSVKSLAMPLIGTGKHKFPEDVVLRSMRDSFIQFSSSYPNSTLKEIRLIRFDQNNQETSRNCTRDAPRLRKSIGENENSFKLLCYHLLKICIRAQCSSEVKFEFSRQFA